MAFANYLSFFLFITLLFHCKSMRESQFFTSKETEVAIPPASTTTTTSNVIPNKFNHNGDRASKATNSIGPSSGSKYYSRYKRSEEHRTFRNYHGNEGDYNDKEEPKP